MPLTQRTLTPEEFAAMKAHRDQFIANNPDRCKRPNVAQRLWIDHLTLAWLNDWREQWGILRCIRNNIGISEAFDQFYQLINQPEEPLKDFPIVLPGDPGYEELQKSVINNLLRGRE